MKPKADDVKKIVDEQNDEVYGEESVGGTMETSEKVGDIDKAIGDAFGPDAEELLKTDQFSLEGEIDKDEKSQAGNEGNENPEKEESDEPRFKKAA